MTFERATLRERARIEGVGLHSGEPVVVDLLPADDGIQFSLRGEIVRAHPSSVSDTSRCTCLGPVRTVEHLMSAFAAYGITDARVELDAPELPGLDGSSLGYWRALEHAGRELIGPANLEGPFARVFLKEDGAEVAVAAGQGRWRYTYDVGERWPGEQSAEFDLTEYAAEVAPARTFVLSEELERVRASGLGRGLDETSGLVVGPTGYENEARFPDEPARHKLLDLIGDLYLSGVPPTLLSVVAVRSGHRVNCAAAARLATAVRIER